MNVIARLRPPIPLVASLMLIAAGGSVSAQKIHNTYGSPLDTLMNTRLTTSVPTAKDFVTATSPDKKTLDYTPLTGPAGPDPERPKPRNPTEVQALQAELEGAGARNEKKAKGLLPKASPARRAKKTDQASTASAR